MKRATPRALFALVLGVAACGSGCVDQCLALPTCPAGSVEVSDCPDGETCTEETRCGTTILCAPDAADAG